MIEQETININNVYRELLSEMSYLMNLLESNRKLFYLELLNRADNDVSRLNILAFNPSTVDTYIHKYNTTRLYFILSKRRYHTGWGTRRDAIYMVIGLNDNRSIYAYTLDKDNYYRFEDVFFYNLDLWQLDFDSNGYLVLPYNEWVRIQGDLVVRRHRGLEIMQSYADTVEIPPDVDPKDVDKYLERLKDHIAITSDLIRAVKIKHRARSKKGYSTYIDVYRYDVVKTPYYNESSEKIGMYAINLSWIGGVRHRIEYYGYEPYRDSGNIVIKVLSDTVRVIHPAHIPITLKVNPGDIISFTLLEQTMDAIDTFIIQRAFDDIEWDTLINNDNNRNNIFIAAIVFQRYILPNLNNEPLYKLYWNLYRYGIDGVMERALRRALKTELKMFINDSNIDFIKSVIRKALELYYNGMMNEITYHIPKEDVYTATGRLVAYLRFKYPIHTYMESMEYVKRYLENWRSNYIVKIIDNDVDELLDMIERNEVDIDKDDKDRLNNIAMILQLVEDNGLSFNIILRKHSDGSDDVYRFEYICVEDKVCISV